MPGGRIEVPREGIKFQPPAIPYIIIGFNIYKFHL
jgi:hypothetical protein